MGIGGSITIASVFNFQKLSKDCQKAVLDLYYGKDGLDYNLGRLSIGSNDFCLDSYELSQKQDLSDFALKQDKKYISPFLKK